MNGMNRKGSRSDFECPEDPSPSNSVATFSSLNTNVCNEGYLQTRELNLLLSKKTNKKVTNLNPDNVNPGGLSMLLKITASRTYSPRDISITPQVPKALSG